MTDAANLPADQAAAFLLGYTQGIADAGARLVGGVAARAGDDSPTVDAMVAALGRLAGAMAISLGQHSDHGTDRQQ
jgi:hypothetical protein